VHAIQQSQTRKNKLLFCFPVLEFFSGVLRNTTLIFNSWQLGFSSWTKQAATSPNQKKNKGSSCPAASMSFIDVLQIVLNIHSASPLSLSLITPNKLIKSGDNNILNNIQESAEAALATSQGI
jgi:hypothetical protein